MSRLCRQAQDRRDHRIIPNHCCPVTNLFDRVNLIRDGQLVETLDVAARGRVD
jgi:D-serine deaminase-like pyridoxal phosphate-dependent protein